MNRIISWPHALVLAAVIASIAGCNSTGSNQAQTSVPTEYAIAVTDKGFEPADLNVPAGKPVTLVITRKTDQTCATEVVFASLNQRYSLPLDQPVRVTLPASKGGTLSYECGMKMLGGRIVVQ